MNGVVIGAPRVLVRTENLAIMVAAVVAHEWLNANWWLFALLFLVPDISMIGYLRGPRLGQRSTMRVTGMACRSLSLGLAFMRTAQPPRSA
jgi:hypothetical protein